MLPIEGRKMFSGNFKNSYIFKYENCGIQGEKTLNYIRVIALQDSDEIITMYPYENIANLKYIDITPRIKEPSKQLVKRMSQIDKFNQRYGIK